MIHRDGYVLVVKQKQVHFDFFSFLVDPLAMQKLSFVSSGIWMQRWV